MAILSSLPTHNPFSSIPNSSPSKNPNPNPPSSYPPPIPLPKYPPKSNSKPLKSNPQPSKTPVKPQSHPSFTKFPHNRTKYYKPISPNGEKIIPPNPENNDNAEARAVFIGESGVSYLLPGAPFEFQFSYSETPRAKPVAIREPVFLPFAPPSMPRPWTGKAPLKSKREKEMKKRKIPLLDSLNPPPVGFEGFKTMEMGRGNGVGEFIEDKRSREEILGKPLSRAEIKALVKPLLSKSRQVNLGRDGLTHNMLELIHSHWKRQEVCKVKSKGVPTVDMDNVCRCLEERTGGKIILRVGGVVYLFRGRNYNYRTRPRYPLMLWKPAAPVYPKLIQDAPGGLTKQEADEFRKKGKKLLPICKLAKNGVYISLVNDVRHAFEGSELVKVDCRGLDPSDYKKIGAKLMELVPCVLLSFDDEQILMWRGYDWKSMYLETSMPLFPTSNDTDYGKSDDDSNEPCHNKVSSSPRMMSLWKHAIESNKALLLNATNLAPDALLEKVEEFKGMTQATEHSYPALITSGENGITNLSSENEVSEGSNDWSDEEYGEFDDNNLFEEAESPGSLGSLPVDYIAKRLHGM